MMQATKTLTVEGWGGDLRTLITCALLCLIPQSTLPRIIGSVDALLTIEEQLNLQSGEEHRIQGFTHCAHGIVLENGSTRVCFDARFPIGKRLELCGGLLELAADLQLDDACIIPTTGTISGNGFALTFPKGDLLQLPESYARRSLARYAQHEVPARITAVAWSYDGQYVAVGMIPHNGGHSLSIFKVTESSLELQACKTFHEQVTCLAWHPFTHLLAIGTESGKQDCFHMFWFDELVNQLSPCATSGKIFNAVSAIAWHPHGDYCVVAQKKRQEELRLYRFDGTQAEHRSSYSFGYHRVVAPDALAWNTHGTCLAIGKSKASAGNELEILLFGGEQFKAVDAVSIKATIKSLQWYQNTSRLLAVLQSSPACVNLMVYNVDDASCNLTLVPTNKRYKKVDAHALFWIRSDECAVACQSLEQGASLYHYRYDDEKRSFEFLHEQPEARGVRVADWSQNAQALVAGDDFCNAALFKLRDTFAINQVSLFFQSDVQLNATLRTSGDCLLDAGGKRIEVAVPLPFHLSSGVTTLKNCTLAAAHPMSIMSDVGARLILDAAHVIIPSTLDTHGSPLTLRNACMIAGGCAFPARLEDGACITLRAGSSITQRWVIDGEVTIQGDGGIIDCAQATFHVRDGATLRVRNCTLTGVTQQMISGTGSVILEHCTLQLIDDITWSALPLTLVGSCALHGGKTFRLAGSVGCCIAEYADLYLAPGTTFAYASPHSAQQLQFADATSSLTLDHATLHAATPLTLRDGTLKVPTRAYFSAASDTLGRGIVCDHTQPEREITIATGYGARIEQVRGSVVW